MRGRRTSLAIAALIGLSLLTGCSSSGSSEATHDPATSSSAPGASTSGRPSTGDTGCPYLDAAQVTAVLGTPTVETSGTVNACFFDPQGGEGPSVLLSRINIEIDPAAYARESRMLCQSKVDDVAAGDDAFACVMGMGPQGQVYQGRVLVNVAVNDAADDATGLVATAALLQQVRIPASDG